MPLLSRDQAQHRADDIQAFYREVTRLHEEQTLLLSPEQIERLGHYHRQLLADYRSVYDIDPDAQARRLSLGMRIASLLGALALAASLLFFFYQFWGLFPEVAQVGILAGFSLGSLLLTLLLRRRDASGYFARLAALLAFACFVLNLSMLGQIFNITPTDQALLPWAAYALLLAYACESRLLLGAGLACLMALVATRLASWSGLYWLDCAERPEHLLPAGLLIFLVPGLISQARYSGFAAIYRVMGLLGLFVPVLVLANWASASYLPWPRELVEGFYQVTGFIAAGLAIWLGNRRDWPEVLYSGLLFFIVLLGIKLFDWWWELMPKYLFFLLLGLVAVLILMVLNRLRRPSPHKGGQRP
ncbi:DUF2157 domain-containing protein [Metapseudomonas resinovorans]|uniref:DUF2157 domain-containing protein n=1 Tax=Metapseudomonas resinovorans NBRC 106553 TaxID=1245471 RepID=S6AHN5_METRE|nr:DUF2157 domain-containing protein [Pseudomonas resinovorans]BAN50042.1 hypothetical protein PCA10_43100 [Pseudomonas resinovorans NBRC 106553]